MSVYSTLWRFRRTTNPAAPAFGIYNLRHRQKVPGRGKFGAHGV
jgi:hypothetical protein